ncbi:MAG: hypothetical protein JXB38_17100 [Anaerolineales bacterium]|nr:hypothetical protein [Anaerolineales bacterium]
MSKKEKADKQISKAMLFDFGKDVHQYLYNQVLIADAKVGLLLTINSLIIAYLFENRVADVPIVDTIAFSLAILFFFLSDLISFLTIFPRLFSGGKGMIFWGDIATRNSPQEYEDDAKRLSTAQLGEEYIYNNYYVSQIVKRKYRYIRQSMILLFLGLASAIFYFIAAFFF